MDSGFTPSGVASLAEQQEDTPGENNLMYDPDCYPCPRNNCAGDAKNPEYKNTFLFTNVFSAFKPDFPSEVINQNNLMIAKREKGSVG